MTHAIVRIRITDKTLENARIASETGEVIEFRDKRGAVHRGRVLGNVEYEVGVDAGWWVWFEHQNDFTTQDIIASMLSLKEKGLKKS